MTPQNVGVKDIFEGAEVIEILGKLPSFLWAYIGTARRFVDELRAGTSGASQSSREMERLLGVLDSAAKHLGNEDLKNRLDVHAQIITGLNEGSLSGEQLVESLSTSLPLLEEIAGPQPENSADSALTKDWLEQEVEKAERIKTGRSADVVVSVDVLDDVRGYLAKEVMTEGISSILVIDNAGTLIVNIGSRIDLDAISLAAVAAANFAATEQIARLIGERDFLLLFYKGHTESFHFSRVGADYIIVTIFNNSLSLGLLRLKIAEVAQVLESKLPKREA